MSCHSTISTILRTRQTEDPPIAKIFFCVPCGLASVQYLYNGLPPDFQWYEEQPAKCTQCRHTHFWLDITCKVCAELGEVKIWWDCWACGKRNREDDGPTCFGCGYRWEDGGCVFRKQWVLHYWLIESFGLSCADVWEVLELDAYLD